MPNLVTSALEMLIKQELSHATQIQTNFLNHKSGILVSNIGKNPLTHLTFVGAT